MVKIDDLMKKKEEKAPKETSTVSSDDPKLKSIIIIDGVDEAVGKKLIEVNVTSVAQIATSSPAVLVEKTGLDEALIKKIVSSARVLLGL